MGTYTEAFEQYGARLTNPRWSVSAISDRGELVVSMWEHAFRRGGIYEDRIEDWKGNKQGQRELVEHLQRALQEGLAIRAVFVTALDSRQEAQLDQGEITGDAVKKDVFTRPDLVGRVTAFDGNRFVLEFRRRQS